MNLQIINECVGTDPGLPTAGTDPGRRYLVGLTFSQGVITIPISEVRGKTSKQAETGGRESMGLVT